MDLSSHHALVTGGGTGIGAAIATALADAGAEVTISGRRAEPLNALVSTNIHAQTMDVSDETSVTQGIAAATDARGPISICIANAGIAEGKALHKQSLEDWRHMMGINLDGTFLTVRECLREMRGLDWGRVIAISSIAGVRGLKGAPAYTASKHGMVGLMRALSADYAGSGLTFNAICPAYVDTDIITRNVASISARAGVSEDQARQMMVGVNPHGRLITPDEVAATALWLCGPGSDSVSGQAIQIAGGEL